MKTFGLRRHVQTGATSLAVAGLAGLAVTQASAQTASPEDAAPVQVAAAQETIQVTAARTKPESPKHTAPLLDTPQTITIIESGTIRAQNLLTLREILSTAPGITFGAGEGGGGYGDSINLRGYAASSDITVDGVRDSAQYTRTDPFNLDQIELVNGANSVYGGSGSLGGSINLVSKTPKGANQTIASGSIGTDDYYRGTLDADYQITEGVAFRLNLMGHSNDVPGRDVERYRRFGIAPSIAFGPDTDTSLTLSYLHQEDDNVPQYGVPYYAALGGLLPGADSRRYYGYANIDTQEIVVDQFTAKIRHDVNDWLSVRNLTRWQEVTQLSIVDPPQGVFCLANGTLASNGAACGAPGSYQPSGQRGNTRDTKNTLFYSQTDLSARFSTGFVKHTAVFGFSFSSEDYHLETGNVLRNPGGELPNPTLPVMDIANPNNIWTGPVNFIRTGISDGQLDNRAVYLFDTMEISNRWEFNAGVRYERVKGEFTAATIATPYPATGPERVQGPIFRTDEDLLSYRFGLVYKPVAEASIYLAYGNTETPSQATVNGGCTLLTCGVEPESGEIYELGVKWNVLDDHLLLSAAIFQNDRTNYKVASNDPAVPDQQLDGAARVRGLSLSATGEITDRLTVFANYTYLDTEVIQGLSDYCLANPLVPGCVTALAANNGVAGNPLLNTPEHSGSFWLTYELPAGFTIGYGASYQGEFYLNNGTGPLYTSESYWVHNAMVTYAATDELALQLNVKNLFDEDYFIRIRNNGWATPGDAMSATLSATYTF
jgi:catecholate siderophore receptor